MNCQTLGPCITVLLLFGANFLAQTEAAKTKRPNVLLIASDDLCCQMTCYGATNASTPNLDRLARKGVRFDRAYCQFPLCNPSRASFLTGLRPDTLRVYDNAVQFRKNVPDAQSLPQTFQKAGYTVARVGKMYHYGVPLQIGTDGMDDPASWQQVINPRGIDRDQLDKVFTLEQGKYGGTLSWWGPESNDADHTDGKIADAVIGLIKQNHDKPFFIGCGFFRPHTPYVAPKHFVDRYPASSITLPKVPDGHRAAGPALAFRSAQKVQDEMSDDLRRQAISHYYASTSYMDAQVGRVLAALDELKLADRTIIAFLSDHGYHLGEHGLWQKMSLFENSARVPLIIYDPTAKGNGKTCACTVELVDLHATLAELAGLAVPAGLDGVSLAGLVNDPTKEWNRPAITQVTRPGAGNANVAKGKKAKKQTGNARVLGYSIRNERYRLTLWDNGKAGVQLFDYQTDPNELTNLADDPKHQEVRNMLTTQLNSAIAKKT